MIGRWWLSAMFVATIVRPNPEHFEKNFAKVDWSRPFVLAIPCNALIAGNAGCFCTKHYKVHPI